MRLRFPEERAEIAAIDSEILRLQQQRIAITQRYDAMGEAPTATEVNIAGEEQLEPEARAILAEIMRAVGVQTCRVTSGERTPETQARIMYENCTAHGAQHGYRLYAAAGDAVIEVFERNRNVHRDACIQAMADKIRAIGPENVSRHCSIKYHVFDVAPSSMEIELRDDFSRAAKTHPRVLRVLEPPLDPSYHIEIRKEV